MKPILTHFLQISYNMPIAKPTQWKNTHQHIFRKDINYFHYDK
jgi:hypothetical protein